MVINGQDGKKIFVHEWLAVEKPVGVVQIVHGMAEHAERYAQFASFLNEHGFMVVADDHRGHGKTDENSLGYCDGDMFEDTLSDEGRIALFYREQYAELKYFVLGFSYGSFIVQRFLAEYGALVDGAVIAGSCHKKDFEVYLGSFVANCNCLFGRAKKPAKLLEKLSFGAYEKQFSDREWLSTDRASNERYRADALCGFTCSYRFYADFFRGLRRLYTKKYAMRVPRLLPLLLISGADDAVGNKSKGVKKLYRYYKKIGVEDVSLVLFQNSRHEFLNESENRAEKWNALLSFFQKHA